MARDECELSVVIACRNGLPYLSEQLDALASEQPPFAWEVIVADNGSSDGSAATAESYQDRLKLTVVDASARRGQAFARNVGVRASCGAHLVFVDDDDVVAPGYLTAMHDAIDAHGFVAAVVDSVTLNPAWAVEARSARHDGGLLPGLFPRAGGGTLGMRRDLFDAVGGMDEGLIGAAEDMDLCWRLQRDTGMKLRLCTGAILYCRFKATPRAFFAQGLAYGRPDPVFYRKWASSGVKRLPLRKVARRWASAAKLIVLGPTKGRRAWGLFILGCNIGRLEGSIRHRVWYP